MKNYCMQESHEHNVEWKSSNTHTRKHTYIQEHIYIRTYIYKPIYTHTYTYTQNIRHDGSLIKFKNKTKPL